MTKLILNPFIYGRPVPTGRFFGRQEQVFTVISRLSQGDSTAIVGEPHIGKTSLLRYIADEGTRRDLDEMLFNQLAFADFDFHMLGADYGPADFWRQVLTPVAEQIEDETIRRMCRTTEDRGFEKVALESLFQQIGRRQRRGAVLIDEFDTLLEHPELNNPEFLGSLRSIATRTEGLALITASRLDIGQMNRRGRYRSDTGSPFFNNMIDVRLPHLSPDEAQSLIVKTLDTIRDGIVFAPEDFALAYSWAGRHPFLLQIAGAVLFDVIGRAAGTPRTVLETRAADRFHQLAAAHFDDYWRTLEEPDQRTLLVLALVEQSRQTGRPLPETTREKPPAWFEDDLQRLSRLGAVEMTEEGPRLAVGGLRRWLMENIVARNRYAADFSTWLQAKGRQNLLSGQEIERLLDLADRLISARPLTSEESQLARTRLAELRRNLRLLEERKDEYVQQVDVPIQLVKDERRIREEIAALEGQLRREP